MKLAEALQERADLNRRIEQLSERLRNSALVQEGERPAEDPDELLVELNCSADRLEELMAAINLTNSRTVAEGMTLTQLIAKKDALTLRIAAYRSLLQRAAQPFQRATRTEIKIVKTVNVAQLQKELDDMCRQLRLLDNQLQQTNWTVEL